MASQTQKGKAFEYACLNALSEILGQNQDIVIDETPADRTLGIRDCKRYGHKPCY